jgi:hypothetical protein
MAAARVPLLLLLLGSALADYDEPVEQQVVATCNGGYKGMETGYVVAIMPPDSAYPEGKLTGPGRGKNGLILGDTVGRTPGAFVRVHAPSARDA